MLINVNAVRQRHSSGCSLLLQPQVFLTALLALGRLEKHIQILKTTTSTHQSHGTFDLHLHLHVTMLLCFHSSLLSLPFPLLSSVPPQHPAFTCMSRFRPPRYPHLPRSCWHSGLYAMINPLGHTQCLGFCCGTFGCTRLQAPHSALCDPAGSELSIPMT